MATINIELKDLYQLLIAECRYGYTRNNHLMPDGAYDHVKQYLPIMLKEDEEYAINTAKQLCDECICDQLGYNFYEGIDDENGSRQSAFKFIEWLLDFIGEDWKPYNYDNYLRNKALDDKLSYNIYEGDYSRLSDDFKEEGPKGNPVNPEKLSKNTVFDYLFREILKVTDITYRRWNVDKYTIKYVFDIMKKVYYIRREEN